MTAPAARAVEADLTLPGHPEVFAIGDMVRARDPGGEPVVLPGVAPAAMQQGRYAAGVVRARLRGRPHGAFRYRDKGNLATIGRAAAVADIKGVRLSGFLAWATWLLVHLWYLIGFQNRLLVLIRWSFSFATHGRGARLINDASDPGERAARRLSSGYVQVDRIADSVGLTHLVEHLARRVAEQEDEHPSGTGCCTETGPRTQSKRRRPCGSVPNQGPIRFGAENPIRAWKVAGVPVRIPLEIVLMLGLSFPEQPPASLGDSLPGPEARRINVGDRVLGHSALFLVEMKIAER